MSKPINDTLRFVLARLPACAVAVLLLAACSSSSSQLHAQNKRDAAAYNVQLGVAYMNQGDLERAKDKLDRALSQDPDNADVHSARATLFARLRNASKADE